MVKFHQSLSDESIHFRYFGTVTLENRVGHERLVRTCFNDYDRELALVAERSGGNAGEILGIARLIKSHDQPEAEFAILVADPWQGQGIGTALLKTLVAAGREEKLSKITGRILAQNTTMLDVSRNIGFALQWQPNDDEWRAEIVFS